METRLERTRRDRKRCHGSPVNTINIIHSFTYVFFSSSLCRCPCWSFFPCLCFGYLLKTQICAPPAHSRFPRSLCLDTYTVTAIYYRFFRILSHIIYRTAILSVAHIDSSPSPHSVAYLYPCTIRLYNSAMARPAAAQPWELVTTLFNNSSLRHTTTITMV